jgi:cell division ATP-binding protein FtsE
LIEFSKVCKSYPNGIKALIDVDFSIKSGEFIFVVGKSGAGKSTMIKLLTCEERPTSGNVLIDQYDISSVPNKYIPYLRRNIGMIFQDFRLINTKTVFSNLSYAMEIVGASKKEIHRRVPIVLSIVGLREKALVRPSELSGGEQQRVAIARALVNNPKIILADEPTGNLDPSNSEMIMTILEQINSSGATVIICTHDLSFVNRMKRRVIEIEDGYLVRDECQGEYFRTISKEILSER